MESNITPNPQYQQVTVDVPEERVPEFHAFFARFLSAPSRRGRGGRRGRPGHGHRRHHGAHGHGCSRANEEAGSTTEVTEV